MDSIANMIIKIKNGSAARKESVVMPYSKITFAIAETLKQAGFINDVTKKSKKVGTSKREVTEITLAYDVDGQPKVTDVKRLSKSSKRVYLQSKEIRPVRSGYGVLVLSTPLGIMTGSDARKQKVGGEALFTAW